MAATRARTAKRIKRRASPRGTPSGLRAAIDHVLDIDFVEEHEVDRYILKLNSALVNVQASTVSRPEDEFAVLRHFVERIPSVFNSVHCEFELGLFCGTLVSALLDAARRAKADLLEAGTRLLDMAIADDFMQFTGVPEALADARMPAGVQKRLADWAENRATEVERYWAEKLRLLSKALRSGKAHLYFAGLIKRQIR